MGHAIPAQHSPVVLRSRFNKLRALLAIALVCVAGLIVAIVSLAGDDDDKVVGKPVQSINGRSDGGPGTRITEGAFSPPSGIVSSGEHRPQVSHPGYDGGPVKRYRAETKFFIGPVDR